MHYIFIVNSLIIGNYILRAENILTALLYRRIWAFTPHSPNIKKIGPGDKVIVYLAGKGRRYFVASFEIDGIISDRKVLVNDEYEKYFFEMFNLTCPISKIDVWERQVPIREMIHQLNFITDKKNWGLFFRQSTKRISEDDYKYIIQQKKDLFK